MSTPSPAFATAHQNNVFAAKENLSSTKGDPVYDGDKRQKSLEFMKNDKISNGLSAKMNGDHTQHGITTTRIRSPLCNGTATTENSTILSRSPPHNTPSRVVKADTDIRVPVVAAALTNGNALEHVIDGGGDSTTLREFVAIETTKTERVAEQTSKVERLKEDLRAEESRLLVIRKLIDSQRGRKPPTGGAVKPPSAALPSLHPKPTTTGANTKPLQPQHLVKGGPAAAGGQKFYIQVGNQLVPAPAPSSSFQFANGGQPTSVSSAIQTAVAAKPVAPPKQTAEQKQSAAKAALRRQLEQTLLQIPPPRPPAADWKAVPNVNSMDFMMLVGLDEVVDSILDLDEKPTLKRALLELDAFVPRACTQCKVDFSPCWKPVTTANATGHMICEKCCLTNVKRELKAEHTTRLKSAFLRALQQEQDVDEKIRRGEEVTVGGVTVGGAEKPAAAVAPEAARSTTGSPSVNSPKPATGEPQSGHHHHRQASAYHHPASAAAAGHHTSLVHQLHQMEPSPSPSVRHAAPPASGTASRWHPYLPPATAHHHSTQPQPHRIVSGAGGAAGASEPEYYVVHHPQHAARWQRT